MNTRDDKTARDAFLAMVSHELRQPLAPILTALEIMRLRPTGDVGERARQTIERQVWQLARFVEDLVEYSNAQRGVLAIRSEPVNLREILDTAVDTAQPVLRHREQRVEVNLADGEIALDGDRARLTQIFANLLNNTAKFTEPGSTIAVDARAQDNTVAVRVRDTSQGISPEKLRDIFRLLVNVEQEQSWPGQGIGLAVVRTLVELHGGSVEAISPTDHHGAEFVVMLPLRATAYGGATLQDAQKARSGPDLPLS